ncbi:hypothetical protein TPHA_0J02130 [Tetrapisispora phaffii CBS 4417]|uniref:Zinc finger PHD-type domain-containing protein n=1 Tax=Tetrapisispora phaffii (strain ATCC 24235 / CBS 4417 / NBRC 1672 / NRRL Y-8282 / UCD 70-5) TaxID=1071381 RepID=G8BYU1_TETPH|nr:hypothetical protein TPHA_0J02130 [Tetrapisispora phaffii CBS 4417]CCE65033.1 hypothetical protein TPHA_0J02130 [Tetrapisispora phaffii CBS 4417]
MSKESYTEASGIEKTIAESADARNDGDATLERQEGKVLPEQDIGDVVEEEDDDGETRCICNEIDPPDESGLYIQCETCGVWQHGFCVGINEGEDSTLDKYWCEQCKPELHDVYTVPNGDSMRSHYLPIQNKRNKNDRKKRSERTRSNREENDSKRNDEEAASNSSTRSRSANSSTIREHRNQEYEAKIEDDPSTNQDDDTRNDNIQDPPEDNQDEQDYEISKRDKSANGDENDIKDEEDGDNSTNDNSRRSQNRKRATLSAREEKQYQLMLEKAINESRRTSNPEKQDNEIDFDTKDKDNGDVENQYSESNSTTTLKVSDNNFGANQVGLEETPSSLEGLENKTLETELESERQYRRRTNNRSDIVSSDDTEGTPNLTDSSIRSLGSTGKRSSGRKSQKVIKRAGRKSIKSAITNAASTNNRFEPDVNKPVKPRLPPQRTSMKEMKRRVAAILEFISRTQWELNEEQESKEDLVRFVENQQFIQQVESIYETSNKNLKLMDELTRDLLLWGDKYNSYSSNSNE